jgi:predicted secreted hydrolase
LRFPRDTGAHPRHRIEWWYVTGQLDGPAGPRGFQVTFFRLRNPGAEGGRSRFSPAQMLFAHAALSDPKQGRLLGDQRSARMLAPLVSASEETTDLRLDDWTLRRDGADYVTTVPAAEFTLELRLAPTQPVMLQGDAGFSRKGAGTAQASYYYSEPQLRVSGRVTRAGRSDEVTGTAWLDHEWSSALLAADAVGWDWLGANLDDGGALMAFRIRDKQGGTLWTTATRRGKPEDTPRTFTGADVSFEPLRTWTSPRTGTRYPVAMRVRVGGDTWELKPLLDDQELDARASTGTLYWEGAVGLASATASGGRGYLELTGYAARLAFP